MHALARGALTRRLLGATAVLGLLALASPAGAAPTSSADFTAELVARSFFRALLEGNTAAVLPLCGPEVNLDGVPARGAALQKAITEMAARAKRRGLRLGPVVVVPVSEALRRHGKPPARLRASVAAGGLIALARFNQAGAVAVLRREGGLWRVIALTD